MKTHPILLYIGLTFSAAAQATNWQATQLTYQAGGWTAGQAYSLNNAGQVVGVMEPPGPNPPGLWEPVPMAFVTGPNGSNLHPIDPGYTPYVEYCHGCHTDSTPQAINDAGQIALSNFVAWTSELSVTLAGPNGGAVPPPPGVLTGFGVNLYLNNSGQLAGTYYGPPVSFVTDANGSNPHQLSQLDNSYDSNISGINDSGQVLVSGVLAGTSENKTFVTGPNATGVAFEVGTYGYSSYVSGLNNSAQLFGGYYTSAGGELHSFVTGANGEGFIDIGSLGGATSANAINNSGFIVGVSGGKPFLYEGPSGGLVDLNQLITLSPGEFITNVPDINDQDQIVALSNLGNMYLLSPVSEPGVHLLMLAGMALLFGYRRQRFT